MNRIIFDVTEKCIFFQELLHSCADGWLEAVGCDESGAVSCRDNFLCAAKFLEYIETTFNDFLLQTY